MRLTGIKEGEIFFRDFEDHREFYVIKQGEFYYYSRTKKKVAVSKINNEHIETYKGYKRGVDFYEWEESS